MRGWPSADRPSLSRVCTSLIASCAIWGLVCSPFSSAFFKCARAFWVRLRSAAIIFPKWKLSIGCSGDFFRPSRYDCSALVGLADRFLDRAESVVEFAGQDRGVYSLLKRDDEVEGFARAVEIGVKDPRLVVHGLDGVRLGTRAPCRIVRRPWRMWLWPRRNRAGSRRSRAEDRRG